jgi:hypothetical protein
MDDGGMASQLLVTARKHALAVNEIQKYLRMSLSRSSGYD